MHKTYFAHKTDDGKSQTVAEHCGNAGRLAHQYGKPLSLENTAFLAGLYHDVGKCSSAFQDYFSGNGDICLNHMTKATRGSIDHSYAGARYLHENCIVDSPLGLITSELICMAIASHHGTYDWLKANGEDYFTQRLSKDDYYQEIQQECRKNYLSDPDLQQYFSLACVEVNQKLQKIKRFTDQNRHFYHGMLFRLLQSIVIDADREDTIAFSRGKKAEETKGNRTLWEKIQKNLINKLNHFSTTDPISQKRRELSDQCLAAANSTPGIYQLVIPTGGGKTLSSLGFGLTHAIAYHKEKIFYIAPFNSILEQNASIFRDIIGDNNAILEHHCNVEEDSEAYELLTQSWHSPVIATTMVQFLNSLFSHRTSDIRRMHSLTNAVIILDEIQALPPKCIGLFNGAINFLSHLTGSTILLCSATQPILDKVKVAPLIFGAKKSLLPDISEDFQTFRRTSIQNISQQPYSYKEAADLIEEKYRENHNILVIVNTKKDAAKLYRLLAERESINAEDSPCLLVHLSTNMCPAHRQESLAALKKTLSQDGNVICISTQLIEAGVDISFHCVIRSLSGLDNIAQAAGRCNRNGESPCTKEVYVIKLKEESLTKLQEISEAQNATQSVFREFDTETDFLAPEAMDAFYKKYYFTQENKMKYILPHEKTSIFDLLSGNSKARAAWENPDEHRFFCQGFKTAGQNFNVIENNTISLLVPYNDEAKKIIEEIAVGYCGDSLKRCQKYTVSLYPYLFDAFKRNGAVYMVSYSGIWILKEGFYRRDIGIDLTPQEMPLDIIL